MYHLKRELKELKRLRKDIGESCLDSVLTFLFSVLLLHIPMLILNAIASSYLVWRIFAFRLGIIKDQAPTKKMAGASEESQSGRRNLQARFKFTR